MCWIVGQKADEVRRRLHPHATLMRTFYASSHDDAMAKHYAAEGWADYKSIPGLTDAPYTDEQLLQQQEYLRKRGAPDLIPDD
jgi:hypothetical protein